MKLGCVVYDDGLGYNQPFVYATSAVLNNETT